MRDVTIRCMAVAEGFVARKQRSLILTGPAGIGKSSLAGAIASFVVTRCDNQSVRWQSAIQLALARADSGIGSTPLDIERCQAVSLLVLDDLGTESARGVDTMREVIHGRFDDGRPTIYTTWLNGREISKRYGGGTARRILERSTVVDMGVKS